MNTRQAIEWLEITARLREVVEEMGEATQHLTDEADHLLSCGDIRNMADRLKGKDVHHQE